MKTFILCIIEQREESIGFPTPQANSMNRMSTLANHLDMMFQRITIKLYLTVKSRDVMSFCDTPMYGHERTIKQGYISITESKLFVEKINKKRH